MRALFAPLLVLSLAAPALAEAPAPRRKLAVPETNVRAGVDRATVDGLAVVIADEAGQRDALAVVSAAEIAAMIGFERQQQLMGCSDASCLAEIGGALGADLLLTSEVTRIGGLWVVSVSLVDVRRAAVLARATRDVPREAVLVSAARDSANQVLDVLSPPGSSWTTGEVAAAACVGGGTLLAIVGGVLALQGFAEAERVVADAASYDGAVAADEEAAKADGRQGLVIGGVGLAAAIGGAVAWPFTGAQESEASSVALAPTAGGFAWSLRF